MNSQQAELLQRWRRSFIGGAYVYLRNRADAEDAVQNAFLKAWQNLHDFRGTEAKEFRAWVSTIVERECLMLMRDRRRRPLAYIGSQALNAWPAGWNDPDAELRYGQLVSLVRALPFVMRQVVQLRDIESLPVVAVAGRLRISVPAAKARLVRARGQLRGMIRTNAERSAIR